MFGDCPFPDSPKTRREHPPGFKPGSLPGRSLSKIFLQSGQTGEPGFGDFVTGKTSPHSATTKLPMTALSAILFFFT